MSTDRILERHKNIASSIQKFTEEIYIRILNHLYKITKIENLCLSGGVALNALANGKIYKNTPFKNVYVFGAAGDSGVSLGAALYVWCKILNPSNDKNKISVKTLYLGSLYKNDQIEKFLKKYNLRYEKITQEKKLIEKTASFLVKGKILGWFQGKMEFGPRALGSRSILCKPWPKIMKRKVNYIKKREQFRPFAGSVLQEKVSEYFDVPEKNHWSPFMTFCFPVKKEKRNILAAITHIDGTCRVQTVNNDNGRYYKLIKRFYQLTGVGCILNTSFNLKGEPIVENPQQAIEDFLKTKMDYLVIEDFIVYKK